MKVTALKQEGLSHTFSIVVPATVVEMQLQQELQAVGKKAKIQGFRPGKVPMTLLKQRYGKDVMDSVLWDTVNKTTQQVLAEKNIRPSMKPDVNIDSYEEQGELAFTLSVESMPEVPEINFESITVDNYSCEIAESEIIEAMQRVVESRKHFHDAPAAAKAANGDAVKIDFLGKLNGEPFKGGKGEDYQLELGSGQFIPGFEEQLIGCKAGDEVVVKVAFPKDYHSKDLAGENAEFDVKVHTVLNIHAPSLDDEFCQHIGFKDLADMKEAVRSQLAGDYDNLARNKSKKQLFDTLDDTMKFEIPSKMVEMEFGSIWDQLQQAKAKGDPSVNKPDAELRAEYQIIAERRVRLGILLAEVGRKNNVQITKEELTRAVVEQARMFPGQEKKVFEFYQKNPEHVEELKGPIIEEKVVDLILSKVKRAEKKVSPEFLLNQDDDSDAPKEKKSSAESKKTSTKKAKKED